jgi:SMI1/KNR4 family protein SUKH-1
MASQPPGIDAALSRCGFYRLEPRAELPAPATVQSAATAAGFEVPSDFADFSARYGAGAFERQTYLDLPSGCPLGPELRVDILYAIGARDDWNPLALVADTYEGRLPRASLPIATDPGGNLIVLGTSNMEGIYAWDHEHRELAENELERRLTEVGSSGVDVQQFDIDQLLLMWDELFPRQVGNPTGYSNLYRIADSFTAACLALRFVA